LQNSQRYGSLDTSSNHIVLIQDLPNTTGSSAYVSRARYLFQTSLQECIFSARSRNPVVFIVTESEVGSGEDFGYSSSQREGLYVRSVLGDEILNHPATSHIVFNPIAKTIMLRGLQEYRTFKKLPKNLLQSVVEMSGGDIRSAINCLKLIAMQLHYSPSLKWDKSM
jgi:cell cycle checkpoint protein